MTSKKIPGKMAPGEGDPVSLVYSECNPATVFILYPPGDLFPDRLHPALDVHVVPVLPDLLLLHVFPHVLPIRYTGVIIEPQQFLAFFRPYPAGKVIIENLPPFFVTCYRFRSSSACLPLLVSAMHQHVVPPTKGNEVRYDVFSAHPQRQQVMIFRPFFSADVTFGSVSLLQELPHII